MPDYIPSTDLALDVYAQNMDTKVTANPTSYGLVAGDATALHTLRLDFTTKLALVSDPATRTSIAVQNKNDSRAALVAKIRSLAAIVNADPDTTDGQRQELGLTVQDQTQTPIPPPATKPLLSVEGVGALQAGLRLVDELTPNSRSKPFGVTGAMIYAKVGGEAPPASVEECTFMGFATRNRHTVAFAPAQAGETAYVLARWINAKGEAGPVSSPAITTIAA